MRSGCTALVLAACAAACYSPTPREGLPCSESGACPEGQSCSADGVCLRRGRDAAPPGPDGGCADADRRALFRERLVASDPTEGDNLGDAIAVSGGWLAIGVDDDDDLGDNAGAVYLFERTGDGAWVERQKLTASNGAALERFGAALAIDGTALVVGAPNAGTPAARGLAYVFERTGSTWAEVQIIDVGGAAGDEFGAAVALRGDHLAIGAPGADGDLGAVHAFDWSGATFTPAGQFIAGDAATAFGAALAIDETTLAVGTPEDDDAGQFSGSVFLLSRSGASWVSSGKLTASDASANDTFGAAVALVDGRLFVGAPFRADVGGVYVYDGDGFAREQVLAAEDGAAGDGFGRAVAALGGLAAVGAPSDDDGGTSTGSVYLFADGADGWQQIEKVTADDGAEFDIFGSQVALDGEALLAGAPLDDGDPDPPNAGAVLVFDITCP